MVDWHLRQKIVNGVNSYARESCANWRRKRPCKNLRN